MSDSNKGGGYESEYADMVNKSYRAHIVKKIRAQYPDIADSPDDELVQVWHRMEIPDSDVAESEDVLDKMYASDWKAPDRTLKMKAGEVGDAMKASLNPLATGAIEYGGSAAVSGMVNKMVPAALQVGGKTLMAGASRTAAGQAAMILPNAIRMMDQNKAGRALEKTASDMPEPNISELRAKGYSEKQIHNIVKGYTDTQQSLMDDVGEIGRKGLDTATIGMVNSATLNTGGKWIEKLAKAATHGAEKAGVKYGLSKLIGSTASGAAAGAVGGLLWGGGHAALQRGAQAHADGEGADGIYKAITEGVKEEGKLSIVGGVTLGSAIGLTLGGVGAKIAQSAERQRVGAEAVTAAKKMSVLRLGETFSPKWLTERFPEDLLLANKTGIPDDGLATAIVSHTYGPEAVQTPEGMQTIKAITMKIEKWRSINEGLSGPMIDLPSSNVTGIEAVGTMDAPNIPGGIAPDVLPPAVQGTTGEQLPGFVPPQNVPDSPAGFEGNIDPQAVPVPFQAEGVTPGLAAPVGMPHPAIDPLAMPVKEQVGVPPVQENAQFNNLPLPQTPPTDQTGFQQLDLTRPPSPARPSGYGNVDYPAMSSRSLLSPHVEQATKEIKELADTFKDKKKIFGDVQVHVSPSDDGTSIALNFIRNVGTEKGAASKVLRTITAKADEFNVPITLDAIPLANPVKGGKIPVDKLKEFYAKFGFKPVEGSETLMRRAASKEK